MYAKMWKFIIKNGEVLSVLVGIRYTPVEIRVCAVKLKLSLLIYFYDPQIGSMTSIHSSLSSTGTFGSS